MVQLQLDIEVLHISSTEIHAVDAQRKQKTTSRSEFDLRGCRDTLVLGIGLQTHIFLVYDVDQRIEEEQAEEDCDEDGESATSCSPVLCFSLVPEELGGWKEVTLDQKVPKGLDVTHEQYYYYKHRL